MELVHAGPGVNYRIPTRDMSDCKLPDLSLPDLTFRFVAH